MAVTIVLSLEALELTQLPDWIFLVPFKNLRQSSVFDIKNEVPDRLSN